MNNLIQEISKLFKYSKRTDKYLYLSSSKNRIGNPIVRIDSNDVKGLMLKIDNTSVTIKSIVNSTKEKGFSINVLNTIITNLPDNYSIIIEQDVNSKFWDYVIEKNPDVNWIRL